MLRLDRIQMREHDWRIASVLPLQLQQLLVSSSKRRAAGMARSGERLHEGVWVLPLHLGWIVRLLKENSGPTKP